MRIVRTQWPIGQGCFSTGTIHLRREAPLRYVYDCGARNSKRIQSVVSDYARHLSRIDALFVSHLDGDHVDGLDHLLGKVEASTVYLPYLSAAQRLLVLAEAEADDRRLTGSLVEAIFEPAGWFGRRGVRRVVFVRNRGSTEEPIESPSRPADPDGGSGPRFVERATVRAIHASGDSKASTLEMDVDGAIEIHDEWSAPNWVLQPYVPRIDDGRIGKFERSIRKALGLAANTPIDLPLVRRTLQTEDGRRSLRRCYDAVLTDGGGAKHNAVSMSLYSGPKDDQDRWLVHHGSVVAERDQAWGDWLHDDEWFGWPYDHARNDWWHDVPGWIGAGDAKLKSEPARDAWLEFFGRYLPRTGTLLLPHHGSRHNFHPELIASDELRACIASADERDEGYGHPHPDVVDEVVRRRLRLFHVTKRDASRVVQTIQRF